MYLVRVTALALAICLAAVVAYVLWPPAAPGEVVQTEAGRNMMRDVEENNRQAAEAGLFAGGAMPALFATGRPLPELPPARYADGSLVPTGR